MRSKKMRSFCQRSSTERVTTEVAPLTWASSQTRQRARMTRVASREKLARSWQESEAERTWRREASSSMTRSRPRGER